MPAWQQNQRSLKAEPWRAGWGDQEKEGVRRPGVGAGGDPEYSWGP